MRRFLGEALNPLYVVIMQEDGTRIQSGRPAAKFVLQVLTLAAVLPRVAHNAQTRRPYLPRAVTLLFIVKHLTYQSA